MPIGIYKHLPHQGFQKEHIPWNKNTKGLCKSTSGSFKKGHHPANEFKKGNTVGFQKGNHLGKGQMAREKHWNWQDGKSFEPYGIEFNDKLKEQIRERDNYTCQLTGQYGNTVHHIDYDKKNNYPGNLITLNRSSNAKVNKNRKYWTKHFNNLITIDERE